MKKIDFNHWFIKDNKLEVSLLNLFASIEITKNDQNVFYKLRVSDQDMETAMFNFYTLEDAVSFIEDKIRRCRSTEEVINMYQDMHINKDFHGLDEVIGNTANHKIVLLPEDIDRAIIDYFGENKNYRVSVKEELTINGNEPKIKFYLIEHIEYDGIKKDIKTLLTEGDLKNAFKNYLRDLNYNLESFKYIGGIHRVGYYFDEDTPYFEGVELLVKEKDKVLQKKNNN